MEILLITLTAGLICLVVPRKAKALPPAVALLASLASFYYSIRIFIERQVILCPKMAKCAFLEGMFKVDSLNAFLVPFICLFGVLICLYSMGFIKRKVNITSINRYYAYLLFTIGASFGAVVANNLFLLPVMWGFGAFMLYLLIECSGAQASPAAKKTFIIVGGSDIIMLLGIVLLWTMTGTLQMDKVNVALANKTAMVAFFCFIIAAFAKAGAIPFHTWIPDSSEVAVIPVMAFLPASLDKLLGIYLLARSSLYLFSIQAGSALSIILMIFGAITVIAAVMMALIQHNFKKLLAYHAVSQVGYMVLGIGTGIPIGIAGGLFHMLNHAIYKSCLFLCGGNVEHKTNESELDKLGGLAPLMPITFGSCLIAALAISGVPPLNGFFSKWMVYQGLIQAFASGKGSFTVFLCLIAAMFGSALTLASFMKLLHTIFLGRASLELKRHRNIKEVDFRMWLPVATLAGLCVIFGVFAFNTALRFFIYPAINYEGQYTGFWHPSLATGLILIGIAVGVLIFLAANIKAKRTDDYYVGGELLEGESRVTGVDFYATIKELGVLKTIYAMAERKAFDIYEHGKMMILGIGKVFQYLHNGILPTYLVWMLLGMLGLFFVLLR